MTFRSVMKLSLLAALLMLSSVINTATEQSNSTLVTYPQPCDSNGCIPASTLYSVRVAQNGNWQESFVYYSHGRHYKDDEGRNSPIYLDNVSNSWTSFSFGGGPVTVEVTKLTGSTNSVVVRPQSDGVNASLNGSKATFTLHRPGQYSIEFNGQHNNAMLIFADPPETYQPNPNNLPDNVHYFGPGIHNIGFFYGWWGGNGRHIQEGDIIYIAGGAYLRGSIRAEQGNGRNLQNVHVIGRGIISGERSTKRSSKGYDAFVAGNQSTITGVTISDPPHFGVSGLQTGVDWVKVMGWYGSTDAYAIRREATIQNSFSKVNDDHIKAEPNQRVYNNVFWLQLNGSAVSLGYTYDDTRSGFHMSNVDVLHADSTERNAVIQATMGGGATIWNYHFEDIRVEGNATALIGLALRTNEWTNSSNYGYLYGITFRNVTLTGNVLHANWLHGQNAQNRVSNIIFDNLRINGRLITNGADGQFAYGPYVDNVRFLQNGNLITVENSATSQPQSTGTYFPEADTWINQEAPNRNYGNSGSTNRTWDYEHANVVYTNGAGRDKNMYLRFNVGQRPLFTRAYLVLMAKELVDGPTTHHVYLMAQDNWGEGSLTWNSANNHTVAYDVGRHTLNYGQTFINVTDALNNHSDNRFTFRIGGTETWNESRYYTREAFTPMLIFMIDEAPILPERNYPQENEVIEQGRDWPAFEFDRMDDVEWYGVWIGNRNGTTTSIYEWFPADDYEDIDGICNSDSCTLPVDVWLPNGDYDMWMTYWGPEKPYTDYYWNRTSFSVQVDKPENFVLNTPRQSSLNGPPTQITWQRDENVLWYQVWLGQITGHTAYYGWVDATEICDNSTCTLPLEGSSMPNGDYELWVEMWGPGGYVTWLDVNEGRPAATFSISN